MEDKTPKRPKVSGSCQNVKTCSFELELVRAGDVLITQLGLHNSWHTQMNCINALSALQSTYFSMKREEDEEKTCLDLREHETDGKDCWCNPRIEEDGQLIIHNSMDEREAYEEGRKLQ